jgi:hypothetical protein
MATIIKIDKTGAPRETILELLRRSRDGRGEASRLTQDVDGFYYAVVDHPDTVKVFVAGLDRMVIAHATVDSLPRKPWQQSQDFMGFPLKTGNPIVDEAAARYVAARFDAAAAHLRRISEL